MTRQRPFDAAQGRNLEGLFRFIDERAAAPFAWGRRRNDCVAYAGGAVKAQFGFDPLKSLSWGSHAEGLRLLRREGGMRKAVDRRFRRIAPASAKRGDIAGVPCDRLGTRLMIVEGDTLVGPGDRGNKRLPRSAMTVAWDAGSFRVPTPARQQPTCAAAGGNSR